MLPWANDAIGNKWLKGKIVKENENIYIDVFDMKIFVKKSNYENV